MTLGDGVKAAALLFLAAVAQVSVFAQIHVFGAVPDVLLVTLSRSPCSAAASPARSAASSPG